MFERYTERARRIVFFARYEASQHGSTIIEPEHLLLGLLREDKELLSKLIPGFENQETLRKDVEAALPAQSPLSTSVDLPFSQTSKRVLVDAEEESSGAGHGYIGSGHLLIGILRESSSAARLLGERKLTRESILAGLEKSEAAPPPQRVPAEPVSRESVHALVDEMAEDQLTRVAYLVKAIKANPRALAAFGWSFPRPLEQNAQPGQRPYTSSLDNGVLTVETHHRVNGHDIDVVESWSPTADGKTLRCTRNTSVNQRQTRYEIEFDLT